MSIVLEPAIQSRAVATAASRNQELLELRDAAYLTAYRIAGNLLDAEDILQDAYVKAVRTQTPLLSGLELRKWFMQITANAARDWLRGENRRRTRERVAVMDKNLIVAPDSGRDELKDLVETELSRLEEKYRAPLSLHYEQGFTYEEASEILGVPAGSLRVHAMQGLKLLRERLDSPSRPLTAEALLALLCAGMALKASPALAASVETIVATGAPVAKTAAAAGGAKVFAAAPANSGLITLAKVAGVAALLGIFAAGTLGGAWLYYRSQQTASQEVALYESLEQKIPAQSVPVTSIEQPPNPMVRMVPPAAGRPPNAVAHPLINVNKKAPYTPPPQEEELWNGAIELLPLIDPKCHAVLGKWTLVGTDLVSPWAPAARIAIPYLPPEEYDYRIDFTRVKGDDLNQIFSVDGANIAWRFGTVFSGYHFGADKNNPDRVAGPELKLGLRYTCIVQVRKQTLAAYIDGVLIKQIALGKSSTEIHLNWRLPDPRLLGLGVYAGIVKFHRIAVREITGKGRALDPDPLATGSVDEAAWQGARSLLPAAFEPNSALTGEWALANGVLSSNAAKFSRYQLNYAPPEEYDLRVEFVRTAGKGEVAQMLSIGGRQANLKLDSGGITTLDMIDGKYHWDNAHKMATPALIQNGVVHNSIVSVRKDGIRAYFDGRLLFAWSGDPHALSLESMWSLRSPKAVAVGAYDSAVSFKKVQLKDVSGEGKELPPPAPNAPDANPIRPPKADGF